MGILGDENGMMAADIDGLCIVVKTVRARATLIGFSAGAKWYGAVLH